MLESAGVVDSNFSQLPPSEAVVIDIKPLPTTGALFSWPVFFLGGRFSFCLGRWGEFNRWRFGDLIRRLYWFRHRRCLLLGRRLFRWDLRLLRCRLRLRVWVGA